MLDYHQPPIEARVCAIVDVQNNNAVWVNTETGKTKRAHYEDYGDDYYGSPYVDWWPINIKVAHVVERLVGEKTGKRIRFGCSR